MVHPVVYRRSFRIKILKDRYEEIKDVFVQFSWKQTRIPQWSDAKLWQPGTFSIRILHFTSKINAVPLCCTAAQSHTAAYSSSASIEKLFKLVYFSSKVTLALNFKVKLMANSVWHWSPKIMISMFLSKNVRKKLLTFLSQNHDFWKWPFQKIMEKCKSKSFSVSHQ